MVFFQKKLRYLKSRISTKFHRLLFLFYYFSIFGIFFSISPIQTCQKIIEFFVVFYSKEYKFYQQILEISKSSFTKIEICEIFFLNSAIYNLFFVFLIIFDIFFSISSICTCQKILEIFMFFYFMDQRFYQRILENHGIFF